MSKRIGLANCQTRGKQTKYKEWLCSCLVLDIILDWVRNKVLVLKEDLQATYKPTKLMIICLLAATQAS